MIPGQIQNLSHEGLPTIYFGISPKSMARHKAASTTLALCHLWLSSFVDLRGVPGCAPPSGSKFFIFMQFSAKNLRHFGSWHPPPGKSWISHSSWLQLDSKHKLLEELVQANLCWMIQWYNDRDIRCNCGSRRQTGMRPQQPVSSLALLNIKCFPFPMKETSNYYCFSELMNCRSSTTGCSIPWQVTQKEA